MSTISGAQARYQLTATGSLTGVNVSGSGTVGVGLATVNFAGASIAYSLRITSTAAGDVAKLFFANSTCLGVTGSPTITNGDGNDLEGKALGQFDGMNAALIKGTNTNTAAGGVCTVAATDGRFPDIQLLTSNATCLAVFETAEDIAGNATFTFSKPAMVTEVTVVATP